MPDKGLRSRRSVRSQPPSQSLGHLTRRIVLRAFPTAFTRPMAPGLADRAGTPKEGLAERHPRIRPTGWLVRLPEAWSPLPGSSVGSRDALANNVVPYTPTAT